MTTLRKHWRNQFPWKVQNKEEPYHLQRTYMCAFQWRNGCWKVRTVHARRKWYENLCEHLEELVGPVGRTRAVTKYIMHHKCLKDNSRCWLNKKKRRKKTGACVDCVQCWGWNCHVAFSSVYFFRVQHCQAAPFRTGGEHNSKQGKK